MKKKDAHEKIKNEINWKWCRFYEWVFFENNFSLQNFFLNDDLMKKIWMSDFSRANRILRWPFNFLQKGFINEHFLKTGKACKIKHQSTLYYAVIEGVELHDEKDFRTKRKPKAENRNLKKTMIKEDVARYQERCLWGNNVAYTRNTEKRCRQPK